MRVDKCTDDWGIPQHKILTAITDNGSNMVAAFKTTEQEESSSSDNDAESMESDSEDSEVARAEQR